MLSDKWIFFKIKVSIKQILCLGCFIIFVTYIFVTYISQSSDDFINHVGLAFMAIVYHISWELHSANCGVPSTMKCAIYGAGPPGINIKSLFHHRTW